MRHALGPSAVLVALLAVSCGGGHGSPDDVLGSRRFVPDRAPVEGEFFLVAGPIHGDKVDLELHVLWPEGKGSLAAVIMYLKLPAALSLVDVRMAAGWPAWPGTPSILPPRGPAPGNQWTFGLAGGIPHDDDGNDCIPFPDPIHGDLHLGTLTVQGSLALPGHVALIPIEEYSGDMDQSGPNSWYCREAGAGYPMFHTPTVGGSFL